MMAMVSSKSTRSVIDSGLQILFNCCIGVTSDGRYLKQKQLIGFNPVARWANKI